MHNRAATNGAARLFTFDKREAASADGYSKTGQNALVRTRPIICCFAPASRAPPDTSRNRDVRRQAGHTAIRFITWLFRDPQVIALARPDAARSTPVASPGSCPAALDDAVEHQRGRKCPEM